MFSQFTRDAHIPPGNVSQMNQRVSLNTSFQRNVAASSAKPSAASSRSRSIPGYTNPNGRRPNPYQPSARSRASSVSHAQLYKNSSQGSRHNNSFQATPASTQHCTNADSSSLLAVQRDPRLTTRNASSASRATSNSFTQSSSQYTGVPLQANTKPDAMVELSQLTGDSAEYSRASVRHTSTNGMNLQSSTAHFSSMQRGSMQPYSKVYLRRDYLNKPPQVTPYTSRGVNYMSSNWKMPSNGKTLVNVENGMSARPPTRHGSESVASLRSIGSSVRSGAANSQKYNALSFRGSLSQNSSNLSMGASLSQNSSRGAMTPSRPSSIPLGQSSWSPTNSLTASKATEASASSERSKESFNVEHESMEKMKETMMKELQKLFSEEKEQLKETFSAKEKHFLNSIRKQESASVQKLVEQTKDLRGKAEEMDAKISTVNDILGKSTMVLAKVETKVSHVENLVKSAESIYAKFRSKATEAFSALPLFHQRVSEKLSECIVGSTFTGKTARITPAKNNGSSKDHESQSKTSATETTADEMSILKPTKKTKSSREQATKKNTPTTRSSKSHSKNKHIFEDRSPFKPLSVVGNDRSILTPDRASARKGKPSSFKYDSRLDSVTNEISSPMRSVKTKRKRVDADDSSLKPKRRSSKKSRSTFGSQRLQSSQSVLENDYDFLS